MNKLLIEKLKILLLFTLIYCHAAEAETEVRVFYVPFEILTYYPITVDNIEHNGYTCEFLMDAQSNMAKSLSHILSNGSDGNFDDNSVRVKIVFSEPSEPPIYLDQGGNYSHVGNSKDMVLSKYDFITVSALFELRAKLEQCEF